MLQQVMKTGLWVEAQQETPQTDAVRAAVNAAMTTRYVSRLEMTATMDAMRNHASECRARYRTAWVVDMVLGQETMMGNRWGVKR